MSQEIIKKNAQYLSANKKLGQNFILDQNVTKKIVRFADLNSGSIVIEVGPGPGGLTFSILQTDPKRLIVIEKDSRAIAGLKAITKHFEFSAAEIIQGDALDSVVRVITSEYKKAKKRVTIISNLPYNVATPLLVRFIQNSSCIKKMVLMFQKEVAERIVAFSGCKSYGRISVLTQAFFKPRIVYHLNPSVFIPPPKVRSAVVAFDPLEKPLVNSEKTLGEITQIFFSNRRKTVGNIVKNYFSSNRKITDYLSSYSSKRPENLDISVYCDLANFSSICNSIS